MFTVLLDSQTAFLNLVFHICQLLQLKLSLRLKPTQFLLFLLQIIRKFNPFTLKRAYLTFKVLFMSLLLVSQLLQLGYVGVGAIDFLIECGQVLLFRMEVFVE